MRNLGTNLLRYARSNVRAAARRFGVDLVRYDARPAWERPLRAGLAEMGIQTVVDVGASTGHFAKQARQTFPDATIIAIEPLPCAFGSLAAWAQTQAGMVVPLNAAVGETDEERTMYRHSDHSLSSSLLETTDVCERIYPFTQAQQAIRVRTSRLDDLLASLTLAEPILLKLDVQGFEDRALRGAPSLLARTRVCMLEINLDPFYVGQASFPTLLNILSDAGLAFAGFAEQVLAADGRVMYGDAIFRRPDRDARVAVDHPQSS